MEDDVAPFAERMEGLDPRVNHSFSPVKKREVESAIREHAKHRCWELHAVSVCSSHDYGGTASGIEDHRPVSRMLNPPLWPRMM